MRLEYVACLLVLLLAVALGGCAEWVNIPPVPGDMARHDPNLTDVIDVEVAAISAVMTRYPEPGATRIVLPDTTSGFTYNRVLGSLGGGVVDASGEAPNVIEVTAVRIQGGSAWVDLRKITATRIPQLMTVYLQSDVISGWYMQRIRPWRGTINEGNHVPSKLQEQRAVRDMEIQERANMAPQNTAPQNMAPQNVYPDNAPADAGDANAGGDASGTNAGTDNADSPAQESVIIIESDDAGGYSGEIIEITE